MDWIYYISLLTVLVGGLFVNIIGLPGNWVMILAVVGYGWATDWVYTGWWTMGSLLVLALLAEVVEFIAGGAGAASAGGTKRGVVGAIVGGMLGGLFLTFLLPVPIFGTIVGACAGAFLGAMTVEYAIEPDMNRSMLIGWGAAKGRLWGILSKLLFGCVMLVLAMIATLPLGSRATAPAAATQPATQPATAPAAL